MKKRILPVLAVSVLTLAGCANTAPYGGDVYRGSQAQTSQNVRFGTVTALRRVQIQAESPSGNVAGSLGGALIGGLLGNQIGGGSGRRIATAAGAIGGGVAGSKVEDRVNRTDAWEIEVRLDTGTSMVVVQKADRNFQAGQRVRVIGNGANASVAPY